MSWLSRALITGPHLALVLSEKEYLRALKDVKLKSEADWIKTPQADATVHWFDHYEDGIGCIVAIRHREGISGIQVAAMLCHEAVHVFQRYCAHIGDDNPSAEFEAYSIQAITQNLLVAYAEKTA